MKPDDFAGYRPHQIRRLLRRGRRPWAPGEGPKHSEENSLFPGGNVCLLTSAPDSAFTDANQLPVFPGPGDPTRIDAAVSAETLEVLPTGQRRAFSAPVIDKDPELTLFASEKEVNQEKEIVAPEPDKQLALEPIQTLQLEGDDTNDEMNEDSSLNESPEFQTSPETENYQEPEIELPLPVIIALQEREVRRQHSEQEFADVRSSKSRNKQEQEDISLSHHAARCSICQHPDRDAIEQGYLHWENPTLLAYEYGLGQRRAVYRHARALGLREKRAARTRRSLEFVIEQGETLTATADSLIRAVRAYSCLSEDGRWTEPTKRVVITHEHIDVVREAGPGSPLRSDECSGPSPAFSTGPLASRHVTLGDGHAVPSKNAVTPAPPTKVEKLMDTLFSRFSR